MAEPLFTLFSFPVMPYSLAIFGAAFLGVALLYFLMCRKKIAQDAKEWFILLTLALGIFIGHFLFCLMQAFDIVGEHSLLFFLMPSGGGFMFYGVLAGCILAAWITQHIAKIKMTVLLDSAAPAMMLFIALARLAEPLDYQGWGMMLNEPGFFPVAFKPYPEYDEWYYAIFLYESIFALIICGYGLCARKKDSGRLAINTLILYASAQILFETLRRDIVVKWRFVRVSQLLSVLILAGILLYGTVKNRKLRKKAILSWGFFILLTGLCVAIEFTVDKPLGVGLISENVCNFLSAVGFTVERDSGSTLIFFPYAFTYTVIGCAGVLMGWITYCATKSKKQMVK